MRNDRVLIPVLHVAHDAKGFSPSVYSHFYRQHSDNFFITKGFNRNRGLAETDS